MRVKVFFSRARHIKVDRTPKAGPTSDNRNTLAIRSNDAWMCWLRGYSAHRRVSVSTLIDHVLKEAAARDGYRSPPPRL